LTNSLTGICDALAKAFVPNLHSTPPPGIAEEFKIFMENAEDDDSLCQVSPDEVKAAITSIKSNASVVPGLIPLKIFKWCFLAFLLPLSVLFTNIFTTMQIPDFLKCASAIPLYKGKGSTLDADNFCPISLLSPLAKIFEVVIFNKLQLLIDSKLCP
jgi:hypothetical protein